MSLLMIGKCLGVSRQRSGNGQFEVTNIVVVTSDDRGVHSETVPLVRDFSGDLPSEGETVALDVFVSKWKTGGGFDVKALRRNGEVEALLAAKRVRAAS